MKLSFVFFVEKKFNYFSFGVGTQQGEMFNGHSHVSMKFETRELVSGTALSPIESSLVQDVFEPG